MPEITENVILPNLVFGIVLAVAGALAIRFRVRLNGWVYRSQESVLGRRVADKSAGRQKPFVLGLVGLFAALMGLVMVFFSVVGIVQNWI